MIKVVPGFQSCHTAYAAVRHDSPAYYLPIVWSDVVIFSISCSHRCETFQSLISFPIVAGMPCWFGMTRGPEGRQADICTTMCNLIVWRGRCRTKYIIRWGHLSTLDSKDWDENIGTATLCVYFVVKVIETGDLCYFCSCLRLQK